MSRPRSEADRRRRAEQFVRLLANDDDAANTTLTELTDPRDFISLGAGLTSLAVSEARELPPAHRAQARIRQERLARLRHAARGDPEALRGWLRRAAEEVLVVRTERLTVRPRRGG